VINRPRLSIHRLYIFIIGLSLIGISSTAYPNAGAAQTPRDSLYQQVKNTFQNSIGSAPGGALAIVYNGQIEYKVGIGIKKKGGTGNVDANTLFRVASTTKTFTAALAAQLAAEGMLDLDEPLENYIDGLYFDTTYPLNEIKLRTLLSHFGGVTTEFPIDPSTNRPLFNCTQDLGTWLASSAYSIIKDPTDPSNQQYMTLSSEPGGQWAYSNLGYTVAGYAIERAINSGKTFRQLLKEHILDPLGLSATLDNSVVKYVNRNYATGNYPVSNNDGIPTTGATDFSCRVHEPCGYLWASVTDMAKFTQALLSLKPDVLSPTAVDEMRSFIPTPEGLWPSYGLGLYKDSYNGLDIVGHAGDAPGYHASMVTVPNRNFAVVVLTNGEDADLDAVVHNAIDLLLLVDTTPPQITLIGNNPLTLTVGSQYVEPGASAQDNVDGDISAQIVITGNVNTNTAGTYYKYYNVSDAAGNVAPQMTRTVIVANAPPPTACFAATNSAHYTAGRATRKFNYTSYVYYAKGSGTNLGAASATTSLRETSPGYWNKVTSCSN
jgi:CubicO group peptidase (beta-lactamase class C family)